MDQKKSKSEITKRYVLCIIGLFFSALGVAMTKHGELGVSPISSVANVMSLQFSMLTLGNWLIIWNCILILGQIVILRRRFQWIQLLQIPLSFLFGYFTDFGMWLFSWASWDFYPLRLVNVGIGTILLGFGIALCVIANAIMNSGEAFVKAISDTIHKDFGTMKIFFDISCVVLAVILSLIFFDFTIQGTREGTVIAALFTGIVIKFFTPHLRHPLERILTGSIQQQETSV
ncbi:MAG: DUF6198 family protein [Eubacteriales bacterium]|nr:DUF6198 family protein [Eubacteriales bacterium]